MKIGMPALVEYNTLDQLINLCMELKLDFIELNMNLPYNFIGKLNPGLLKKTMEETGIEFTMHMPDEADLGVFYESVRRGYEELFSETIEWAGLAGIKLLNMHIIEGAKMTLPDKKVYIYQEYSREFKNNFIKSIKTLSEKAMKNNVALAVENSANFGKAYIQDALNEAVLYPNVGLTWDTGHDAVSGFTDREFLMLHEKKIVHMHVHDVIGKKDHQILFRGDLDIRSLLEFAGKKNIDILAEVKTADALKESIYELRTRKFI